MASDINGKMNKKLLNKSTKSLLIFCILVLIVSAPAFYFIVDKLYIDETDETLSLNKEEFFQKNLPGFTAPEIPVWNKYNKNVQIVTDRHVKSDSLFSTAYWDNLEKENEPYRELNTPVVIQGKTYTYLGRTNLIEKEDMALGMALLFLIMISLLLSGILLINKLASEKLWKPFYNTLNQIQDFEIDKNREPKFEHTRIEEFDRLNKSIERLIVKNTAIYKTQREFVENAAHELQTPLALFQAKVETLFQTEHISAEQSLILSSLNTDISRLNRLNKNLLLLSKIENDQYTDKQPVMVNDALNRNMEFFKEQAKAKNLLLETDVASKLEILSNQDLVEVLINNLFLNAIRHNIKDGKIIVSITGRSLVFLNTGQATALDPDKLFNRFSKSDSSSKGNGLGLAIVKKIAEINHWEIAYSFNDQCHGFTITFPS
jgi:signal transduction histidine kinase